MKRRIIEYCDPFSEDLDIPLCMNMNNLETYTRAIVRCLLDVNFDRPDAMKLQDSIWHHRVCRVYNHLHYNGSHKGHAFYSVPLELLLNVLTYKDALEVEKRYPLFDSKGKQVGIDFDKIRRQNPKICGIALWVPDIKYTGFGTHPALPFCRFLRAWTVPSVAVFDDSHVDILNGKYMKEKIKVNGAERKTSSEDGSAAYEKT